MHFKNKPSQLIRARTSWRKYTGEMLADHDLSRLKTYIHSIKTGLSGRKLRFRVVAATPEDPRELQGLGTYGFIHDAAAFIIGAIDRENDNLEDYGKSVEEMILFATDMGLGTCWLGGSFHKSNFSKRIKAADNEIVPAVVSVGYPTGNRGMVDNLIRKIAGSINRKPWDSLFFEHDFKSSLNPEASGPYREVLEMVRLAPSASNRQPWRIIREPEPGRFHFFLERTKGYRKPGLFCDLQRIDMGIAMSHFELVCKELGLNGSWIRLEDLNVRQPDNAFYTITWEGD